MRTDAPQLDRVNDGSRSLGALLQQELPELLAILQALEDAGARPRLVYLERHGVVLRDRRAD